MAVRLVQRLLSRSSALTVSSFRSKTWTSRLPAVAASDAPLYEKVIEAVRKHAENPTKLALISGDCQFENLTYKDFLYKTEAAASFLSKGGFVHEDVACLMLSNSAALLISHLAVLKCGGVATITNISIKPVDLEQQLEETNSSIVFVDEEALHKVLAVAEKCKVKTIFCVRPLSSTRQLPKGVIDFAKVISGPFITEAKNEEYSSTDLAIIPYAVSANGSLVGELLTHGNISTAADIYKECLSRVIRKDLTAIDCTQEHLLYCSNLANMFGLLCMDIALIMGFTSVLVKNFDHTVFMNSLHSYRPRLLIAEPRNILAAAKQKQSEGFYVDSLEYVLCSGPTVGKRVRKEFLEQFPSVKYMVNGVGLLNGAPGALIPNIDYGEYSRFVSCVVPTCDTKIICAGKELEANEYGEILLRGPTVMQGYTDESEAIDPDGWYHTGEIGHVDKNGHVFVSGRLDDFIDVNGYQVCLKELEDVLLCHPLVADAAVLGVEDAELTEIAKAFIVPNDENLTAEEVQLYICGQFTEKYKHLTGGVEFVDAIPRGADGHILREELSRQFVSHVTKEEKEAMESE